MYRLVVLKGAEPGFRTVIREMSVLVGRDDKCRVCLADPWLAPQHLALRRKDGQVVVQVLQGAGEVLRRGEALTEAVLNHGDVLEIGDLHLQFQVVRPLPFHETRSTGIVFRMAGIGLVAVLVLELLIVGWLWHAGPARIGAAAPVGEPAGPDRDVLTNELATARTRLEDLEARQEGLSPEEIWASGGSLTLTREIDQVRTRVTQLDATLQEVDVVGQEGPAPRREDVAATAARTMLTEARRLIAANDLDQADDRLGQLLDLTPGNVQAYMTRARLRERMGDPQAAIEQWDEVINRSVDVALKKEATTERVRLLLEIRQAEARQRESTAAVQAEQERQQRELIAQRMEDQRRLDEEQRMAAEQAANLQAARDQTAREQAARERAARDQAALDQAAREQAARDQAARSAEREQAREQVTQAAKVVQIDAVRREKFQNRENYDEIRLVRIELKRRKSGGPVLRDRLRVDVEFYDKEPTTGEVFLSRVPAPRKGLDLAEDWTQEGTRSFSALYMVPRGFRASEQASSGRYMQFHGYVVRAFYDGQLQDEYAFPATLLP